MELTIISWIVGFVSAIFVMFFTEMYKEKRRGKKERLDIIKEVKFFLNHYRDRFSIIEEKLDVKSTQLDWVGNLRWYSDQIQQRVTKLYDEDLLSDVTYEQFLDFNKELYDYSILMETWSRGSMESLQEAKKQMIKRGQKLLDDNEGLIKEILTIEKTIKDAKIWKLISY